MKLLYVVKKMKYVFFSSVIIGVIIIIIPNIKYTPINLGDAEGINRVNLVMIKYEHGIRYSLELDLTDKTEIENFVNKTSSLRAKKILSGGSKNVDMYFYIHVDYNKEYKGERLLYCMIYGNQILLTEGGSEAYEMSHEDWEQYEKYIISIFKEKDIDYFKCF